MVLANHVVYVASPGLQYEGLVALKRDYAETRIFLHLMKTWQCIVCGFIYDEAEGWEEEGIAPGTKWEDVPEDWVCPECGVGKADFEMMEV